MLIEMKNFFRGKKVLLTGNTGFKGTWMTILLKQLGAAVYGYSLPIEPASFFANVNIQIDGQTEGDIADISLVYQTIDRFKPEIIIHLASHSSLDRSDKIPEFILKTNIMGVVNLLEVARNRDFIKAILIVTSDKCYKNLEIELAYTEESLLDGKDPYSASKVCQELISECYRHTFFEKQLQMPQIATARASNVIGPGDYNVSRLLPYLMNQFLKGEKAVIRSRNAVRPWQYVLDVLWGYLLLVRELYLNYGTGSMNGAYNFGPKQDGIVSVERIVQILSECFEHAEYEYIDKNTEQKIQETQILKLDSKKAMQLLNWKPRYSLVETLEVTAEFYNRSSWGEDSKNLCSEYVDRYLLKVGDDFDGV